tara:strand:+ start:1459 stop:1890 length:432 start_codon:yes stop_codon:yes gene_type:complete
MKIKILNKSNNPNPSYSTVNSAGMDIRAFLKKEKTILPGDKIIIDTGIFVEIPTGYEIQIRPRSGLSFKNGITVLNTPGTIDSDYRGEVKVILINLSKEKFTINNGDRIAQMVVNKYEQVKWQEVDSVSETERKGGFGSTGIK